MPLETGPQSSAPRIRRLRVFAATAVFLFLLLLSLAYHDGAFGTQDLSNDDLEPGTYRFKGRIESWDAETETFRLVDSTGSREFHWNITRPEVGRLYVVDAELESSAPWKALALTPVFLIEDRW